MFVYEHRTEVQLRLMGMWFILRVCHHKPNYLTKFWTDDASVWVRKTLCFLGGLRLFMSSALTCIENGGCSRLLRALQLRVRHQLIMIFFFLPTADTVLASLMQESPSLWHFMTMRRGQKKTSASGKENASRLSTACKSLQLRIILPAHGRNARFSFCHWMKGDGAASGVDRTLNSNCGKKVNGGLNAEKGCSAFIIWSRIKVRMSLSCFSVWMCKTPNCFSSCSNQAGSLNTE